MGDSRLSPSAMGVDGAWGCAGEQANEGGSQQPSIWNFVECRVAVTGMWGGYASRYSENSQSETADCEGWPYMAEPRSARTKNHRTATEEFAVPLCWYRNCEWPEGTWL